eukprot:6485422-Amphidinium_carterae.2
MQRHCRANGDSRGALRSSQAHSERAKSESRAHQKVHLGPSVDKSRYIHSKKSDQATRMSQAKSTARASK